MEHPIIRRGTFGMDECIGDDVLPIIEGLMRGDVFNADFVANWLEMKQKEYDALRLRPHPYEFAMYYDV